MPVDPDPTVELHTTVEPDPEPRSHRRFRRAVVAAVGGLVLLGAAAAGAVAYDRSTDDRFLPGVRVAGTDVGGRTPGAVLRRLDTRLDDVGAKTMTVSAGRAEDTLTLTELGLRWDAADAVRRARADARDMALPRRVWHRLLDQPVDASYPVRYRLDQRRVDVAVSALAKQVDKSAADAKIDTSTGFVNVLPAQPGQAVDRDEARARILDVGERLANGQKRPLATDVDLPMITVKPKVTAYADILLVRTGENRLYHYENHKLVKSYSVATGVPKYPTPKGTFQIVVKRRNPTWVNPDPGGWGASMPARIGPGPGNPLGTRALNLSAPGIRIHGTTNVGSLGSAASHGCIRMSIADSEELFDRVETNTKVVIIQGPAPAKPASAAPSSTFGNPDAPVELEAG